MELGWLGSSSILRRNRATRTSLDRSNGMRSMPDGIDQLIAAKQTPVVAPSIAGEVTVDQVDQFLIVVYD